MLEINYLLIMLAALLAIASPGPATLAIAGASMSQGKQYGLATAAGIFCGSLIWSCTAAFGLAAIMYNHAWLMEFFRYLGAGYLMFLAYKSIKSALANKELSLKETENKRLGSHFMRGLLIHLTNPKAILFFASLYSIGIPNQVSSVSLISVILAVASVSGTIFFGYALLFSNTLVRSFYIKSQATFEYIFAAFFGIASVKIFTTSAAA